MSRRNKNKYNFHPQNVSYYPNYNNYNNYNSYNNYDYNNYNNYSNYYNTHSQQYNNDDNYNYNTKGRFQKRQINQRNGQNRFNNDNYQFKTYDNPQYTLYQNDYVNADQKNDVYFSGSKQDTERDCIMGQYSQNDNGTNSEYFDREFKNSNEMPSSSGHGTLSTEETEKNIDNLPETDMDRPSTRTILKKSLETSAFPTDLKKQKTNSNYTDNFWKKGKDSDEAEEPCYVFHPGKMKKKKKQPAKNLSGLKKVNQFEKKVNKMLSAPVEMSKGRSLLEKMGWKGGGLGKDGEGIVEPIAPKVTYATTTLGLGQLTEEDVEEPVFVNRVHFATLKCILEFVKNYLERELKFEASLTNHERKRIHRIAEALRLGTLDDVPDTYKSMMEEIDYYNDYLLVTESTGERKKKNQRYLTLYKEAHDHMFLISPEDLEDEEEITDDKETNGPEQVHKNVKTISKLLREELTQANNPIDKEINNKTENKEERVETNDTQNHMNSPIEEMKNDTEIIVIDSNFDTNKIQNQADNQIGNDTEIIVIDSETEEANNIEIQISSKTEKEISNDTKINVIDSQTEEANDIQNQVNSKNKDEVLLNENYKTEVANNDLGKIESKNITDSKNNVQGEKQKDKPKDVNDILNIIINYFVDYTEDPLYTELRFLGPFNHKERRAIDMFFEVCKKERTIERSKEVLDLFDCNDYYLELRLDNNGRYVIYKIEKDIEGAGIQNA